DGAPGRHTSDALADLDNDGYPDLVAGSNESQSVAGAYWVNDRSGSFASATMHPLPGGLYGPGHPIGVDGVPLDLNSDGFLDLLLSETPNSPAYVGRNIQILMNDKQGGFVDETALRMPGQRGDHWAEFIAIGDFDADGDQDLFLVVDFEYPTTPAPENDG